MRVLSTLVGLVVCGGFVLAAGCGGDDEGHEPLPLVDRIDEAVAAVEQQLGGSQEYFEITATPQQVQVFVAVSDASAVRQFVYVEDELAPVGRRQSAEGQTFTGDEMTFDPDTVLDQVVDELPSASLDTFSVIGAPNDTVRYGVYATSSEGGRLDIIIDADGSILEGGPADSNIIPSTSPPTAPAMPSPRTSPPPPPTSVPSGG